jgi:uncharacterized protein (DUF2384 family)
MYKFAKHCGAKKLSGIRTLKAALIYLRRRPLQKKNAIALAEKFIFNERQTARMIGMSLRLYRMAPESAVLTLPASENVIQWCELYEIGVGVFDGDARSFVAWLNTRITALERLKPIEVLESGMGTRYIIEGLLRMEHSVA